MIGKAVFVTMANIIFDHPPEILTGEYTSRDRKICNLGSCIACYIIITNDFMKSRFTWYNLEILGREKSLVYFGDMPFNYPPTVKGNKELGSGGLELERAPVNSTDLLT